MTNLGTYKIAEPEYSLRGKRPWRCMPTKTSILYNWYGIYFDEKLGAQVFKLSFQKGCGISQNQLTFLYQKAFLSSFLQLHIHWTYTTGHFELFLCNPQSYVTLNGWHESLFYSKITHK